MKKKKANQRKQRAPAAAARQQPPQQAGAAQLFGQAETHRLQGSLEQAAGCYRQALAVTPTLFAAHNNLGMTLIGLGRYDDAAVALRQALAIDPDSAPVLINMGLVLKNTGHMAAAAESFRKAIAAAPAALEAHYNLGNVLRELGQPGEAVASYQNALAITPGHADSHNNCGRAYWELGQTDQAIACYLQAIRFKPQFAAAYSNLGHALLRQGKLEIAQEALRQAIAIDPAYATAHLNLAGALLDQGKFVDAIASYRAALVLKPGWPVALQGLLFVMSSTGAGREPAYLAEVGQFGQCIDQYVDGRAFTSWQPRAEGARLRVGMVSGDLRSHPVAYFLEGVLGYLPGLGIDVVLYPTSSIEDAMSARLRSLVTAWHPLTALDDAAAAQCIHADGIDVLIDLSGHTFNSRLPIFGWRPAPLQVSWLGYFATTGVRQMDAILVDPVGVPRGSEAQFTEQVCYLPDTRLCFSAPTDAPRPAPLPAASKGHVTFGCFQHHPKVSDAQLALWARVLDAVPGAVVRWQCMQFADPKCVEETAERLIRSGIGLGRAQLFGHGARKDYLAAHADVDIILDTSPYPGGTTTCEALWMGVPTVTLAGDTLLSRQGASLLTAAGLADWVADSEDDYVARAVSAARDLPALARLRAGLRQRLASSPLCDGHRFAANLHAILSRLHHDNKFT